MSAPKPLVVVPLEPPPPGERVQRNAVPAGPGVKKTRYSLPDRLDTSCVVGYRTRVALSQAEANELVPLLSLPRPEEFGEGSPPTEGELFEECSLGVLTARQSTNYRGFRQVTFGPEQSAEVASLLRTLHGVESVVDGATHTHLVFGCKYRTPFTMLLTFAGHRRATNIPSVLHRVFRKRMFHDDDIPTIGYLPWLHTGILADGMQRAAVIASDGKRDANTIMRPFCGTFRAENKAALRKLARLGGLSPAEAANGWRPVLVVQVGTRITPMPVPRETFRKLGANLLAFRSERIQPGVNNEERAPAPYQKRQSMRVPQELVDQAGRAAFNAFAHHAGCGRERAKELLLLDRIDVLTPGGKERLRAVRKALGKATDYLIRDLPRWADLATGKALSRNANRGRKAFALAGQRIYVSGLDHNAIGVEGLDWEHAVKCAGAAAARSALYCELMGTVDLPDDCDLLAGICLMAGPVNQNDIYKQFYGGKDLLADSFPDREPTSLLVWTLKGKTVADPIGNEEQLMNARRKGALVDLRPGPAEVVRIADGRSTRPLRGGGDVVNRERAFGDVGNFVTAPDGTSIPGNVGEPWPETLRSRPVWS